MTSKENSDWFWDECMPQMARSMADDVDAQIIADLTECAKCGTTETVGYCRDCKCQLCDRCAWSSGEHRQHMDNPPRPGSFY